MNMPPEPTRAYIYNVLLALAPVLVATGVVASSLVPLYLALAAAVLGVGLARANVTRKPPQ